MFKHERGRTVALSLLAIAGFFALFALATTLVRSYQKDMLRTTANVVSGPVSGPKWTDLNVVDMSGDSLRARDLRTHTINGHAPQDGNYDLIHVQGNAEMVYLTQKGSKLYAITQKRSTIWSVAPRETIATMVLYWFVFAVLMGLRARANRRLKREIEAIAGAIHQLRYEEPVQTLLVGPNSRVFPLAHQLQELQADIGTMRQKIARRRERFVRLVAHLPQGIMLIDDGRKVHLTNPAIEKLLGVEVNHNQHPYVDDVREYQLAHMIEHVLRTGHSRHREIEIAATGKRVDANIVAVTTEEGVQALVILYDVTYLRSIETMQNDFVANASHELKTPITAIRGFAETLQSGAKDDPKTRDEFIDIIATQSQRLTELIDDILAVQRGGAETRREAVNIHSLVELSVQNLAEPIAARKVEIIDNVPTDLNLTSDPGLMTQIIRNLIDNAVFYNHDGGTVTIHAEHTAGNVRIQVIDTGVGISENERDRIFERFYRVDKARSRNNGGTGLGLAIVAGAVAALDGTIRVDSQPGVGTTFTVDLPAFT